MSSVCPFTCGVGYRRAWEAEAEDSDGLFPVRAEEDKGAFIVPVLFLALSFFLLVGTCKVEADADTEVEA